MGPPRKTMRSHSAGRGPQPKRDVVAALQSPPGLTRAYREMRAEKCWASGRESVFVFVFVFGRGQRERGRLAIRVRESAGPLTPAAPRSRRPLPL